MNRGRSATEGNRQPRATNCHPPSNRGTATIHRQSLYGAISSTLISERTRPPERSAFRAGSGLGLHQVRGFLGDEKGGGAGVAVDDLGHDGRVGDAQRLESAHL